MKSNPERQSFRTFLTLVNLNSLNLSSSMGVPPGLINSSLDPNLIRAPNQDPSLGKDALHLTSSFLKSIFLSINQSSTKIKFVNLFIPAFPALQVQKTRLKNKKSLNPFKRLITSTDLLENFKNKRMGRLRFELRTSRLKAGCSTTELATRVKGSIVLLMKNITLSKL